MKRFLAAILILGLFASMAACAGDEKDAYVPTGDALVMEGQDPESINPPEALPRQDVTMVYYPNRILNPLQGNDFTNRALFSLIYQGLFNVSSDYKVAPILCQSYRVSPDNRTWTFYLDKQARFSDGTPVDADDVLATYQAAMESGYYSSRFVHVKEMFISEDGGVTFKLGTAYENFPILLDVPIVKAEEVAADRPIGSGPYLFEESLTGAQLRRVKNWWCNVELVLRTDAIPLVVAESPTQVRDQFEFYDVSIVCANPYSDNYADFRGDFELWTSDNGIFLFLGCNVAFSEIISDRGLRTALTYAIDRATIAEVYCNGFATPTTIACSPNSPYYSETLAKKYEYDPVRFVDALATYGRIDKEIRLLVNSDDSLRVRIARYIAGTLTELGLPTVTVEKATRQYQDAIYTGSFDLYLGQTKLSANMDLTPFFSSSGAMGRNGISNNDTYSLCRLALENKGNYYNLHQTVATEARIIPILFAGYSIYATRGLVSDMVVGRDCLLFYEVGRTMTDAMLPVIYDE